MDSPIPASQPLVSVVLPIYNGEPFLAETLQSLFAQDHQNFEAIAVIDGSLDGSLAILERFADPRLRVIWKENGGAASAVAAGVAATTGELIAFLDQDDLWMPSKLHRHTAIMAQNPTAALTFSWFRVIDAQSRDIGVHSTRVSGALGFQDLLADFVIGGTSNVVVRRDALLLAGGPDPDIPNMFDLDLFVRIALQRPGNILAIPEELMCYRRHAAQVTRNIPALQAEWDRTLNKLRGIAPTAVASVERLASSNMHRYFARLEYEGANYTDGLRQLGRGLAIAPLQFAADPRNLATIAACLCGLVLPAPLLRCAERLAGIRRS